MKAVKAETLLSASDAARAAASAAGVAMRDLEELEDARRVAALFADVWGRPAPPLDSDLLRALALSGNQLTGAFVDGELIGATCAFLGHDERGVHLHSHITGVRAPAQGRAVGFALKQHQRAWALERGIVIVEWTFDPLVRRNAFFNLTKLGATVGTYLENVYGEMSDGLNAGAESDRAVASWRLDSERAAAAASGRVDTSDGAALQQQGAIAVLGPDMTTADGDAPTLLMWVPDDIVALRRADPDAARGWRMAVRTAMGRAMSSGYTATGMTRDGWYVFER